MQIDTIRYPNVFLTNNIITQEFSFSRNIILNSIINFGNEWLEDFETLISRLFENEESLRSAIRGYSKFSMQSMREQAEFERTLTYKAKTFEQAADEVYLNQEYMISEYLPGLLLSHYIWPHHYRQLNFFKKCFLIPGRENDESTFIEIGVGTGIYSSIVLQKKPFAKGIGIDISPSSIDFTRKLIEKTVGGNRYNFLNTDIRDRSTSELKVKTLICVEVLEHLEDPLSFLKILRNNMAPGGRAFITAAINAAHTDHIYLYRNNLEVKEHLVAAGFQIEQFFVGSAYPAKTLSSVVPEAVAFIVYV